MLEVAVRKRIGTLDIDAQFDVPEGVTVLFGPSGAGKSTILRMVAGLMQPDSGYISNSSRKLFDSNINISTYQRKMGFVFQDGLLFPHMTVRQNLLFAATADELIDALVEQMEIGSLLDRNPRGLSGGERQRVAIARAMLGHPECLLLDEPLASLDQGRKDLILPYLKQLRTRTGTPVLYVTHSIEETFRLADRIVLIEDGKTGISGSPADVFGTVPDGVSRNPLAGGLLTGKLVRHFPAEHLSEVKVAGSSIFVAQSGREAGSAVRIRLNASDVSIARIDPSDLSILNRLPARISRLVDGGSGGVGIALELSDGQKLTASVTSRAAATLELCPGMDVIALFKTVSLTPDNLD
jgi:molybdate transport system ATP-binding protein